MPADSYTYRVLAEGYEAATSKSTPFTEGETTVNFELQPMQAAEPAPVEEAVVALSQARDA